GGSPIRMTPSLSNQDKTANRSPGMGLSGVKMVSRFACGLAVSVATLCLPLSDWSWTLTGIAKAQDSFNNYEIRVIRPKFMKKRGRIEMAGEMTLVMNQSFIYSLLATGLLDYHFSESLAIELGGSYGFSI